MTGALFFGAFDFFPIRPNLIYVFDVGVAENMRMSPNQFIRDVTRDVVKIESTALVSQLAMENDL